MPHFSLFCASFRFLFLFFPFISRIFLSLSLRHTDSLLSFLIMFWIRNFRCLYWELRQKRTKIELYFKKINNLLKLYIYSISLADYFRGIKAHQGNVRMWVIAYGGPGASEKFPLNFTKMVVAGILSKFQFLTKGYNSGKIKYYAFEKFG